MIKTIKISDYFELIKPKYTYLKIIPHKSVRNYNSANIAKAIKNTYKTVNKRIHREQKKFFVETNFKISYVIDIYDNNISFYFLTPVYFKSLIIEKIREIWSKVTIEEVDNIKEHSDKTEVYQLSYKNEDALSLDVNKKSNEPLSSIMNVMEIMKNEDRITIVYNFLPRNNFGWIKQYQDTIDKIKEHKPVLKEKFNSKYITMSIMTGILGLMDDIFSVVNDLLGNTKKNKNDLGLLEAVATALDHRDVLSTATKKKRDLGVIDSQIAILSDSLDKTRQENNAISICQSYRSIDEDNELIGKKIKLKGGIKMEDYKFEKVEVNTVSTEECQNFIQLPARELMEQFKINYIKVEEVQIPEKLRKGYVCIGVNKNKGTLTSVYLEDDIEIGSLPLLLLGRQGGGKTTYMCNYAGYCLNRDESLIHIDFIRNCEASKDIERVLPKDRSIILDFSTEEGLQSLAYNEIKFTPSMSWFDKQQLANKKTELTLELINAVNVDGEPLSNQMERFFCSATNIVYLNEKATLKDVIKMLTNYRYRQEIINKIPEVLKEELEEDIQNLEELNEWSKETKEKASEICGTKDSKITGILDRITLLKRDFYLKKMFNKSPDNNIDFSKAMEEGKVILVRMPQSKFKDYVKNVITTFLLTKCWVSVELRGELSPRSKRCHVLIDEISQTKTAEKYMESKLTQTRKYGLKFVLTGQYLNQLYPKTIKSLKGAGCSFMLLKGAIKEDFNYFKDELDGTFEYEDLKDMEKFSSLNIIQYSDGFTSCITKLPKPI